LVTDAFSNNATAISILECTFTDGDFNTVQPTNMLNSSFVGGTVASINADGYMDVFFNGTTISGAIDTTGLSVGAKVRLKDGDAHSTRKTYGIYEKQSTTKYAGSNALKMSPTNADNALVAEGSVFAISGATVAYSAYFRKDAAMTVLPYLKLSGAGITASTATMVNTQDDWQLLTVSGLASENGFCKVEFVCQNASGNVYVDDDQDSFTYWFEGDIPSVVPKPSLTANDIMNTVITDAGWSTNTFGDLVEKTHKKVDDNQALIISK